MSNLGARRSGIFKAVSTAPSINKTPVGNCTPPLAYPTTEDLSNSVGVTLKVNFNKNPAYVLDRTTQPSCKGDSPGTAKGIKSGTVSGEVRPVDASNTVFAEGKRVVREGDPNTMNGGNNPGLYVTDPGPDGAPPKTAAMSSDPPPAPEEKSWLQKAAKYYKDNVSQSVHKFASDTLDVGGKTSAAGGVTMGAGVIAASTVVAAPATPFLEVAGAATVAVGGGVSAVGGATDIAATGADNLADYVLTGHLPDFRAIAWNLGKSLVLNRITKFIPGLKGEVSAAKTVEKSEIKATEKAIANETKAASSASPPGNRVRIKGKGGKGPCDHLKRGSGEGEYRGGAHSETSQPTGDGKDSHHAPPKSVSPLDPKDGPAIQMDPEDHERTSSHSSNGKDSIIYRQKIGELLAQGRWREAMAMEIKDIRRVAREIVDPRKYNQAMKEKLAYFKCLERHGLS